MNSGVGMGADAKEVMRQEGVRKSEGKQMI